MLTKVQMKLGWISSIFRSGIGILISKTSDDHEWPLLHGYFVAQMAKQRLTLVFNADLRSQMKLDAHHSKS